MARMTKAQLVDENTALRHNLSLLEAQVAELRAQLEATQRQAPAPAPAPAPQRPVIVSTYTKHDGSVWHKVRVGWNQYAHRPAHAAAA